MPFMLFQQTGWVNSVISHHLAKLYLFVLSIFSLTIGFAFAQGQPTLMTLFPQGGQQGRNVEITMTGTNLGAATAMWFSGSGITADIKEKTGQAAVFFNGAGVSGHVPTNTRLVVSLMVSSDAPLGIQQIRVVTPHGVSNAASFVVGNLREIEEEIPSTIETDWIALPVTVNGTIASIDDEDSFTFDLKKEARLICEVTAQRIGSLLDSYLVLQNASGTEVANSGLGNGLDSVLDYTALETGKYTLRIRDIRYKGGPRYGYRLSIGELPYLETIFPLGGRRGTENTIAITGANLETLESIQVSIGSKTPTGEQFLRVRTPSGLATNGRPFAIGSRPERIEAEPNNTADNTNVVTPPITINGKIDKLGDVDRFSFEIKEPQSLVFEVEALKLSSKLDALLTLYLSGEPMESSEEAPENDGEEHILAANDDPMNATTLADARIDWNFEEPGKYSIAIRDLNNQGGETYPYRLHLRPLEPDCKLTVIGLNNRNVPSAVDNPRVSRGSSVMLQVAVTRLDQFTGPIRLLCPDLPKTFDVSPTIVGAEQNRALLTVTAPLDSALGLMPFSIVGVCSVNGHQIERSATPSPILLTVMDVPEFSLRLAEVGLSVIHNKTVELHVTAERRYDFVGPIELRVSGLPNRVSSKSVTIADGTTGATLSIKAGTFERREQFSVLPIPGTSYISVAGTATVTGESVRQATPAIPLTIVEAPFIVTVEPLRFSIVFPAGTTAKDDAAIAIASNPRTDALATASDTSLTKETTLTLTIVRQGGFTDEVTLAPIKVPEGLTTEAATILPGETEVKVPLKAIDSLAPGTYRFRFRGSATINGNVFEQDSPILNIKIIH